MRSFPFLYRFMLLSGDILGPQNSGSSGAAGSAASSLGTGTNSVLKLIGLIIVCALIIFASYFVTKFVGKRQQGVTGESNFKSIDVFRVSQNKYLQIVKAGTRYFLIAVCKDSITLITEMSAEEITKFPKDSPGISFKDIMTRATSSSADKEQKKDETGEQNKE